MAIAVLAVLTLSLSAERGVCETAQDFFNDNVLHEIRISIHPSDWQRLHTDFKDNTYYPCDFRWRGLVAENIGIRSRGFGSRNGIKPGLRVDFNRYEEDQEFLGLKSVVLKPNVQDPSQLKERLTMFLFSRMGLPAPREAHARLYVNDQYVGLYAIVESIDKRYLKRNFGEDDGYLYQYEWVAPYRFEYLGPEAARYVTSPFEPKTHEKDPKPGPLVAMIREMNESSDSDFPLVMAEYLDLKLVMTHLAIENFVAELDGIAGEFGLANFFLYRFEGKNRSQFLVWDKDRTFHDIERSIFKNLNDDVLTRRALAVPELRRAFLEALWKCGVLVGGEGGWLEHQITRLYNQVVTPAQEDTLKLCPDEQGVLQSCSNAQFEDAVTRLKSFAAQRGDFVRRAATAAGFRLPEGSPQLTGRNTVSPSGVLVAGSQATLLGERLTETTAEATSLPLPTTLGGVSVIINGFPAPLLYVSPDQVNFQVPWEISSENVPVTAIGNGALGNTLTATVGLVAPTILGVAHTDGGPVSTARPAESGEALVVYATGLGPVTVKVPSGQPAAASPQSRTLEIPNVTIGGVPMEVSFSGLAAGLVGVYQLNARMPAGVPASSASPLVVSLGGAFAVPVPIPTR